MKNSKYILLITGALGLAAGIYAAIAGQRPSEYSLGLICGASLVFGYFEVNKKSKTETK